MRSNGLILLVVSALVGWAGAAEAGWEEGLAALKAGKYADAAREFQAVTEQHQDWPDGFFMLGQSLQKLNRNDDALKAFRTAYDLNPNEPRYQLKLGEAYLRANRYREAAEALERVKVASLPKEQQAPYHQMVAVAMEKSGRSGQALQALKQAAAANPGNADAQFNYGAAAFNAGNTAEAEAALAKAVSLDGSDAAKRKAYVDVLLRQGREARGDAKVQAYRKAVDAAGQLARQQPTYDNYLLLGEAQLGATQYQEAAASFNTAATKKSGDWLPHFYMGQAYTASQSYSDAEAALRKALATNPGRDNQVRVLKQLAFVYEKEKKFDDAIKAYNDAGDSAGATRVQENAEITKHNQQVEKEQAEYDRLKKEEEELKKKLQQLETGPPR